MDCLPYPRAFFRILIDKVPYLFLHDTFQLEHAQSEVGHRRFIQFPQSIILHETNEHCEGLLFWHLKMRNLIDFDNLSLDFSLTIDWGRTESIVNMIFYNERAYFPEHINCNLCMSSNTYLQTCSSNCPTINADPWQYPTSLSWMEYALMTLKREDWPRPASLKNSNSGYVRGISRWITWRALILLWIRACHKQIARNLIKFSTNQSWSRKKYNKAL